MWFAVRFLYWEYRHVLAYSPVGFGQYAEKGQIDIAVLCFFVMPNKKIKASILIYWGGEKKCPDKLNAFGFAVGTEEQSKLEKNVKRFLLDRKMTHITHDGLVDEKIESVRNVYYCINGKWEHL